MDKTDDTLTKTIPIYLVGIPSWNCLWQNQNIQDTRNDDVINTVKADSEQSEVRTVIMSNLNKIKALISIK